MGSSSFWKRRPTGSTRQSLLEKAHEKKLSWHTTFGDIVLSVQVLRQERRGQTLCPFEERAKVKNRSCSRSLQRRTVDFYAERSGPKTQQALREHYGIDLSLYAVQQAGARASKRARHLNSEEPASGITPSELLVVEADGSMVPVIEFTEVNEVREIPEKQDRRKRRQCVWKEIRLSTVHDPKRQRPRYGVARGTPLEVGCMIHETCRFEGMTDQTRIHGVADGAPWIATQFEEQFGTQHTFLIDYYHVCEYLAGASQILGLGDKQREAWYHRQRGRLRQSRSDEVLEELSDQIDQQEQTLPADHPLIKAHRYLQNRSEHLDYAAALAKELPIGSGEVESAHRSVLQDRLKIAGAWWLLETAETMAHLRVLRANDRWEELWKSDAA